MDPMEGIIQKIVIIANAGITNKQPAIASLLLIIGLTMNLHTQKEKGNPSLYLIGKPFSFLCLVISSFLPRCPYARSLLAD